MTKARVFQLDSMKSIEERQQDWLRSYPDKFLACREGHDFPKMVKNRKGHIPRTRFEPWTDPDGYLVGCYYQEQFCSNCGRIRYRITGPPGAFYSEATKWIYKDPHGYATPKGLGISKGMYMDQLFDRVLGQDQDTLQALEEHGS